MSLCIFAVRPLLLVVALASVGLACGSGGSDEVPLPETAPFTPELEARLKPVRDKMMEIRELTVDEGEIEEGTLTRDQLRAYYDEVEAKVGDEDRQELETFSKALRLLHIIGPDDDLLSLFSDFGSEGTLGFFSRDDEKLVLISESGEIGRDEESTMAHEYVHLFQAAAFDLDRFDELAEKEDEDDDARTEYNTTLGCLLEGDAELAEAIYGEVVLGPAPEPVVDAGTPPAANPYADIPAGFLRYMLFEYRECERWATQLFFTSGWDEINAAYADPPSTTEQILHPEKFLVREEPTRMPPIDLSDRLGKDWDRIDNGIFGEFDAYNYLVSIIGDPALASNAAEGWGVGWLSLYNLEAEDEEGAAGEQVLAHVALEFDTAQDHAAFMAAMGIVVDRLGGLSAVRAPDGPATCWTSELEHGYVSWDDAQQRVDIVMGTDGESVKRAASDFLSTSSRGTCPGW